MPAGGRTLHSNPSNLSHTAQCWTSRPWPPRSHRWLRYASPGPKQTRQPPRTGGGSELLDAASTTEHRNRKCFRETTLDWSRRDCGKYFRGPAHPPKHPDSWPWSVQSASPQWSSDITVPEKQIYFAAYTRMIYSCIFSQDSEGFLFLVIHLTGNSCPYRPLSTALSL